MHYTSLPVGWWCCVWFTLTGIFLTGHGYGYADTGCSSSVPNWSLIRGFVALITVLQGFHRAAAGLETRERPGNEICVDLEHFLPWKIIPQHPIKSWVAWSLIRDWSSIAHESGCMVATWGSQKYSSEELWERSFNRWRLSDGARVQMQAAGSMVGGSLIPGVMIDVT